LFVVSQHQIYPGIDVPNFRPYEEHVALSCTDPGEVYFISWEPLKRQRVVSPRFAPWAPLRHGGPRALRQSGLTLPKKPAENGPAPATLEASSLFTQTWSREAARPAHTAAKDAILVVAQWSHSGRTGHAAIRCCYLFPTTSISAHRPY